MNMNPVFSIVTVVYNGEAHLEQTITSVLEQDYPHIEYIIIDGGSVDRTCDLIKKYEDRIDYWVSEPDNGIYDAMNKGIRKATGTHISFLNADDYLIPGCLSKVAKYISETSADISYGNQMNIWEDEGDVLTRTCIPNVDVIEQKMGIFHPATFVKKSVFDTYGLFDESFAISGDYEFIVRVYAAGCSFSYLPTTVAAFRFGGASSSLSTYLEGLRVQWRYRLPYKRAMLVSLLKRAIKKGVHRFVLKPLGIAERRKQKQKLAWRNAENQELMIH